MASRKAPLIALVDVAAEMGGVEFSTLYLAEHLNPNRFRCVVVCPEDGDLPRECRARGISVEIVPVPRFRSTALEVGRRFIPNPLSWLVNAFLLLLAAWRYRSYFKARDIDLVCTKGLFAHFYAALGARWCGVPSVIHLQDLISRRAGGLYSRFFATFARQTAHHVIADGSPIQEQLAPYLKPGQITVVHNGVDLDVFSPEVDGLSVRQEWGVTDGEILIGNIARLTTWKGQDYLVKAFGQIAESFPKAKLALIGAPVFTGDRFEHRLHQLVGELQLADRVIFAGYRWDLPETLAALDVYVHSSVEKDTSPLAVVSAMAAGKPILTTNVSGVAELFVQNEEAILVKPGSAEALAAGLTDMLSCPARRQELGQAARAKAEKELTLDLFVKRCEEVFIKCLGDEYHGPDKRH